MIREHLFSKRAPTDPSFRWRGGEISRLEGLSDGVFAVTLTLIVVTLNVPETFYDLWLAVRDLPVFLVCFASLLMVWRYHYIFFRRYGLEDFLTTVLNSAFLFIILFYAYPLRFLTSFLWKLALGESREPLFRLPEGVDWGPGTLLQREGMMYFYGLGVVGVFGTLALMLLRAYHLRDVLELDELERFLTRASLRAHGISAGLGVVSLVLLALTDNPGVAGIVYFLLGPAHTVHGIHTGIVTQRLLNSPPAPDAV